VKNIKIIVLVIIIIVFCNQVFAQEFTAGGVIYGDNWAFAVTAPNGWVMDSNSMAHQGIYGLFYEEGKRFGTQYNTPIIYIVPFPLNNPNDNELRKFAQSDINGYISRGAKVEEINKTYKNRNILYLTYNVDLPNGRYETFVFTRNENCCLIIILNANSNDQRNELFQKLEQVVNSIIFMEINH
jgi:hypothetical protein